jgi:hypothetical protein
VPALACAYCVPLPVEAPPDAPPVVPPPAGGVGVVVDGADVDGAVEEGAPELAGGALSLFLLQAVSDTASTEARIKVLLIIRYLLCDGI